MCDFIERIKLDQFFEILRRTHGPSDCYLNEKTVRDRLKDYLFGECAIRFRDSENLLRAGIRNEAGNNPLVIYAFKDREPVPVNRGERTSLDLYEQIASFPFAREEIALTLVVDERQKQLRLLIRKALDVTHSSLLVARDDRLENYGELELVRGKLD